MNKNFTNLDLTRIPTEARISHQMLNEMSVIRLPDHLPRDWFGFVEEIIYDHMVTFTELNKYDYLSCEITLIYKD